MADADKFGRNGLVQTCPCWAVTTLVTDHALTQDFASAFSEAKVVTL